MKISVEDVAVVKDDAILVEQLPLPEMIGSLHVPESAKDAKGRRKAWRAQVVKFGEGVDYDAWKPYTLGVGAVVLLSPESIECPAFVDGDRRYVFVRDEDVLAVEATDAQP